MSNNKTPNPAARQAILKEFNKALSNKISQTIQTSSKKKASTSNRSSSSNKKPQIHEVINLENE